MDDVFALDNASLVLRLIHYLSNQDWIPFKFLTVIFADSQWIVRLRISDMFPRYRERDLEAFLWEIGAPYNPDPILSQALQDLELGRSPTDVMQQYQLVVVSHGHPNALEVEIFRRDFIARLGYTPCTLV